MHFIEHIIEPSKLLLAWQPINQRHGPHYIVAELHRGADDIALSYLSDSKDFIDAKNLGFEYYPAFKDTKKIHYNVLGAFMRRICSRSRTDFPQWLAKFHIKPDAQISDFALLGYSGAKLLGDGFCIVKPS